jgi:hypothetical protein
VLRVTYQFALQSEILKADNVNCRGDFEADDLNGSYAPNQFETRHSPPGPFPASNLRVAHLSSWRILAINGVAAFSERRLRAWSMCEQNSAYAEPTGSHDMLPQTKDVTDIVV